MLEKLQEEAWLAIFGNLLQIGLNPFTDDSMPRAELATHFMRWSLAQTLDWFQVTGDLLFDALMDSVGVAKICAWEPPWPAPNPTDSRRYLKRLVTWDALDLGMLLVAPDAESSLQYPECRYVAQEFFLSRDDIYRLSKKGFDTPDWDEMGDSQQMTERKRVELEREGQHVTDYLPDTTLFIESYERFELEEDIGEEDIIVSWFPDAQIAGTADASQASNQGRIAGVRRLIDVFPQDDRPRRPFFPVTFWPQSRQWRGLNVSDRLESMQDLINRLHEQLVNYGEVSMLPFVFVNTFLTGEIPDLRTVRPGSTVPIDDLSGVQFAPTRSLNRHFAEQIQMMQANVERDSRVTDFNLGRNSQASNAPRTAAVGMALLAQNQQAYGKHIRWVASRFDPMLSFHFRLWQEILPDDSYIPIFAPRGDEHFPEGGEAESSALWDRIFAKANLSDMDTPVPPPRVALPISKDAISGFFDAKITVNPEKRLEQQILMQLFQVTAPAVQNYPLGYRTMLKRIWGIFDQRNFDEVYPEQVALMQTQQTMLAMQVQIATFQAQLQQIAQAQAQQQLATLQQHAQQFQQTGQVTPELQQFVQEAQGAPQNGTANGATLP